MIALVKTERFAMGGMPEREMGVFAVGETHLLLMGGCPQGKWSGTKYPPSIGDRVTVNFNGFGAGTVTDYFVEGGWLGVEVQMDKQPEWHRKQQGPQTHIRVFGLELNY